METQDKGRIVDNMAVAAQVVREKKNFLCAIIKANKCELDADDILQNLFLSLAVKPVPADAKYINSYLYHVLIHDIIDEKRKCATRQKTLIKYAIWKCLTKVSIQDRVIIEEEYTRILALIEIKLPPYLQKPLYLRYKYGYSIAEISEKLGVKKNVIRVYLSEALKKIRNLIKI